MAIQQTNQQIPLTPAMREMIDELKRLMANPVVETAFNEAVAHVRPFVEDGSKNPWVGATAEYFVRYFEQWFTFLPEPTGGLGKIVPFTYFYLDNKSAFAFLNTFKSRTTSKESRPRSSTGPSSSSRSGGGSWTHRSRSSSSRPG
ncbi:hypothetical protein [Sorangium sp. So ce426]|uniref:hypothetical protein n=1 Tax=unclassified Sorangium TaxID=2621164 RepID=UPI003F5B904D